MTKNNMVLNLRQAAQDEVQKAVAEVAEADICRTCYICRKAFPVNNIWQKDQICPDCLNKLRKLIGIEDIRPGHWIDKGSLSCRCSACGCKSSKEYPYCPNCGTPMEK